MFLYRRIVPGLAVYSYIVGDLAAKQAVVIDPTRDVEELEREALAQGLTITHILETHVHADFISGAAELKARLGGKPVIVCSAMGGGANVPKYADTSFKTGDNVRVGKIRLEALHTPGHTPEHLSWLLFDEDKCATTPCGIFSGDFLFVGDIGRPDLVGDKQELSHALYRSVFDVLPKLPTYLEIYPSHGAGSLCGKAIDGRPSSTLGYEMDYNPSLKPMPEAEWTAQLLKGMPQAPLAFKRMRGTNLVGAPLVETLKNQVRPLGVSEIEKYTILDVRSKEAFATSHVPGSLNIPLNPTLGPWATWVLPYDRPIALVLSDSHELNEVLKHLYRVGHDQVVGYLQGGIDAWQAAGKQVAQLPMTTVHDLAKERPFIVDVRGPSEWMDGHIAGAHHLQVLQNEKDLAQVPKDKTVAVVCRSGQRASIAGSLLQKAGHKNVVNVLGGMVAWRAAGYPVEKSDF